VEAEICPPCPWSDDGFSPTLGKFLDYMAMQDAGCPVDRHELLNEEWRVLGALKAERERMSAEKARKKHGKP